MTTEEYFKQLASSLELTDEECELVADRHKTLRDKLDELLDLEEHFLTGSYKRKTLIRPKDSNELFDVDFFLAFSNDEYGDKDLPELKGMVEAALQEIKEDDPLIEDIREQNRSVGVIYIDNFQIDAVPAIQVEKDVLYKIYDKTSGQAVMSNPKLHGERLTQANEASESGGVPRLVPIVKILKSWKRDRCTYLKSFHLEMLVVEILGGNEIPSYSQGIADFFSKSSDYLGEPCLKDPANKDNMIDEYLDEGNERRRLLKAIARESMIAKHALELEDEGKDEDALDEWQRIFKLDIEEESDLPSPVVIPGPPPKPWCNV